MNFTPIPDVLIRVRYEIVSDKEYMAIFKGDGKTKEFPLPYECIENYKLNCASGESYPIQTHIQEGILYVISDDAIYMLQGDKLVKIELY